MSASTFPPPDDGDGVDVGEEVASDDACGVAGVVGAGGVEGVSRAARGTGRCWVGVEVRAVDARIPASR